MASSSTSTFSNFKRLIPYAKRYKKLLLWGVVFITLSNICSTTIPRVVGQAIDTVRVSDFSESDILLIVVQIVLLTAGSGVFMYATRRSVIVASRYIERDLRSDFVASIQTQSLRYFHDRSTGSILAHFTNDISAVREFIGPAVMYTCHTITTFAFALSWMTALNATLTYTILIPVPFITWATYSIGKKIHVRFKSVQEEYEHITTHAQESFSGVRVVRAYVREDEESVKFDDLSNNYYKKNMNLARINSLMMPSMTVLFNLTYVVVLALGGYFVTSKTLTVGELTQFFIYLNQLLWPIAMIGWVTSMIQRGSASMGRIHSLMDAKPDIVDPVSPANHEGGHLIGDIEFDHVSLKYSAESEYSALQDLSFKIPSGASVGIVGSVGSGKSSIVNLIPRLYDATDGAVRIDGTDVRTISLRSLRTSVGVVPQESFLFSTTIAENIRFSRPDATLEEVQDAAKIAQIDSEIRSLPNGYQTIVGERGVTLSGGQKQRTALARAILQSAPILILDDSLSAVDTDTEERILQGLRANRMNSTLILISHRISTVKDCDAILVLQNGRIAEKGSHEELLKLEGMYKEMFDIQQLEEAIA